MLQNKKKLPRGIFTDKEYSVEVERERRKLRPILQRAKQLTEYKNKSKMEGDKLIIKGKSYSSSSLHLLPELLTGYNISSKNTEKYFFGELNPLSNFHRAPFTQDGILFHSSEQWIQYQKAKLFHDEDIMDKTLSTGSALECKQLSKEIRNFDPAVWKDQASTLCEPGLIAKFEQNPTLLQQLKSTGDKHLCP